MRKTRKYFRKRKNTTQKSKYKHKFNKTIKGGTEVEKNITEIYDFINDSDSDYEISGKYTNGESVFTMIHVGERKGNNKRASVKIDNNDIIWHTHPPTSKYYPSVEDICKVLKHPDINVSIIFTIYGVWVYKCNTEERVHKIPEDLTQLINGLGDDFYRETEKGRTYNIDAILNYIFRLKNLLIPINPTFNINWYNKHDFIDRFNIVNNIDVFI
jgi:hypothetical protein